MVGWLVGDDGNFIRENISTFFVCTLELIIMANFSF